MIKNHNRFEPAVHLGLLVIIFILLFLNFRSNLTIYHAGNAKRKLVAIKLRDAAQSINRTAQKQRLTSFDEAQQKEFAHKYRLTEVYLVSPGPQGDIDLAQAISDPMICRKLTESPLKSLVRGDDDVYYYRHESRVAGSIRQLIISLNEPELAYLEDSSKTLVIVNVVAVSLIVMLYLLLFRLILSPIKRIRREAIDAGRHVEDGDDEVEAVVKDYRRIISELKEKETQLIEMNEAIRARADRLELFNEYLLRSMSSGMVMIDREGRIISVNKAAGRILGVDPSELIGETVGRLPKSISRVFKSVDAIMTGRKEQSYNEMDMDSNTKPNRSLGVTVSAIQDYTSHRVGASVLINDLTEIKSLRKEVEAKNRLAALGEMAGGLAHQLRNSIGAMSGYSHLVKKRLAEKNMSLDAISALDDESKEAERLVDRFLKFARPFDYSPESTPLSDLVSDLVSTFRVRPENSHIDFVVTDNTPPGSEAVIDALLIKQAVANLVGNAINAYDGQPGRVEITLASDNRSVTIEVRDYGCGISPDNLDKIFTPFFSSRPSGTGLGLPLAGKIVDLHRGRLLVDSEPGQGTSFTISLPHSQATTEDSSYLTV